MEHLKIKIVLWAGVLGSLISKIFGGWTPSMTTLVTFMMIDYISGLVVAAVFKKSRKTPGGALDSRVGFKGMIKKGSMLVIVYIAVRMDLIGNTTFIKNTTIIGLICNELTSIGENFGLMGVPYPKVITDAFEVLSKGKEGGQS